MERKLMGKSLFKPKLDPFFHFTKVDMHQSIRHSRKHKYASLYVLALASILGYLEDIYVQEISYYFHPGALLFGGPGFLEGLFEPETYPYGDISIFPFIDPGVPQVVIPITITMKNPGATYLAGG